MAENTETQEPEAEPKKAGAKGLVLWVVVAVVMAGIGFAIPMAMPSLFTREEAEEQEKAPPEETSGPPAFIAFDENETVVNLNTDNLNRYLSIAITMQVSAEDEQLVTDALTTKKAILRSWLISYLGDVSMDDIRGAAGQNRLRREIQDQFNTLLFDDGYDRIRDILFEQFNVQ